MGDSLFQRSWVSLCSASHLSLPRSPHFCSDVCDSPSLAHRRTHSLAGCPCATTIARASGGCSRTWTPGAAGFSARPGRTAAPKLLQLPDPPRPVLNFETRGRSSCPTSPFCATEQGLKSLLQRKPSFNNCSAHLTIALFG